MAIGTNNLKIKDLTPYAEYKVSVAAGNVHGFGEELSVSFVTSEAGKIQVFILHIFIFLKFIKNS